MSASTYLREPWRSDPQGHPVILLCSSVILEFQGTKADATPLARRLRLYPAALETSRFFDIREENNGLADGFRQASEKAMENSPGCFG
jgi:hypothetical protein